jgi:MFS family permease
MVLDAIEVSVVLVALPSIGARLNLSLVQVQWLMSGFAVGFAALLLLGPVITHRCGRRRVYLVAMVVFVIASMVGGLGGSAVVLITARVVKGGCAALTAPTGLAMISTIFPDGSRRRRAVSVYSLFGAAGFTVGLLLSGVLLQSSWRLVFLFPAPIALALLVSGLLLLPSDPGPAPAVGSRIALLRDGSLVRSALGAAALNGGYIGLLLIITFQTQQRLGWAPWQTALGLLPASVPLALTVPFAGRMVARFGTAPLITGGALAAAVGEGLYVWRSASSWYPTGMLPSLLLVETGFVLSFAALNMQSVATVVPDQRGVAVSLYQTAVQFGAAVTLPLVSLLLSSFTGCRPALLLVTAVGVAGLVVALSGSSAIRTPRSRS